MDFHASSAAALVALTKAIEIAGTTDRDAVRSTLKSMQIDTFFGPIDFRDDGMNQPRDLPVIQVQNGSIKVINPPEIKSADMILMDK